MGGLVVFVVGGIAKNVVVVEFGEVVVVVKIVVLGVGDGGPSGLG